MSRQNIQGTKKWFNDFKSILKKDFISTLRVKKYLFSSIIPPLVLFTIFSLLYTTSNPESFPVVVVDLDDSDLSNEMVDYISNIKSEFSPWFLVTEMDSYEEAEMALEDYETLGIIVIYDGFQENISTGGLGYILLEVQNINWDYPKNYIQRLDEAVLKFNQDKHLRNGSIEGFSIVAEKSYLIGDDGTDINLFRGLVIGIIGFYGIIFGLLMGSLNISKEYDDKTMLEIINSPISKSAYIASKQLIGVFFGIIITTIIGTIFIIITGVDFKGGILEILIILISFILSTWIHANIGTLIGWKFKSVTPSILVSIIFSMILWFICGGFGPPKMLGNSVFYLSRIFPGTYWSEILFCSVYYPTWSYIGIRFLYLIIFGIVFTVLSWTLINRMGFKLNE